MAISAHCDFVVSSCPGRLDISQGFPAVNPQEPKGLLEHTEPLPGVFREHGNKRKIKLGTWEQKLCS